MRLNLVGGAIAVAAVLLAVGVLVPPPARGQTFADVRILFDLGDGTYEWSAVHIPDTAAVNASWRATLDGAARHGLEVNSRWFPFGVAVRAILPPGWPAPPAGFAALYLWNRTTLRWDLSGSGISDLVLRDGDAIAWANAGFDSVTFAARYPVPTPLDPLPAIGSRADAGNSGSSPSEAPNSVSVLWDRNLSVREIASAPAVAYGRAFILTMAGLFALNEGNGTVLWENASVRGFSTPAVGDRSLFLGARDGRVYRVNTTDGAVQWSTALVASPGFSGITSSPRLLYDWVVIGTFNESGGPGELVSLWQSNGTVAWRAPVGGSIHYSTPAYVDGLLIVGVMGRYNTTSQVTYDPPYGVLAVWSNGTQAWYFPTPGPVAASPLISGDLAIAPCVDGRVYAVSWRDGTQVWQKSIGPSTSSPALVGDTVVVGSGTLGGFGNVTALNASTGAVEWRFALNGPVQASIAAADGKVFASTNTPLGTVYALNASTGALVWFDSPEPADYILGSPVVSNGTLFVPTDSGHVLAIREADSAPPGDLYAHFGSGPADALVGREPGDLTIAVSALRGRLEGVRLYAVLTPLLEYLSASPAPSNRSGAVLRWDAGDVEFGDVFRVTLRVRAAVVVTEPVRTYVTANMSYAGGDGDPYESPLDLAEVPMRPVGDTLSIVLVAIAVIAIAVVAVLILYLRVVKERRRRVPPT